MGIFAWVVLGLVAGLIAQFVVPVKAGKQGCGCLVTPVIGIAGAAVGGLIATQLGWGGVNRLDVRSIAISAMGAILVLLVLGALSKARD